MKAKTVKEYMQRRLVTLESDMPIEVAIQLLLKNRISGAPVVDEDRKLIGVLSEKDCLRIFANGAYNVLPGAIVEQYMSRSVHTIDEDADLFTAADVFLKNPFRRLPIVDDDGRLVGQISRRDVLNGSREVWESSSYAKQWTDAKYLTDEIKAALGGPSHATTG
jgi:predicted transcriptional regulator